MAFHIHSPQSYDWGQRSNADPEINDPSLYLDGGADAFLDHLAEHYDVVCITDHMRTGFACELAAAAGRRDDITVFPGMEVNCVVAPVTRRVHLLAIFPPERSVVEIDRIFATHRGFPGEDRRSGQEDFQSPSLRDLANDVQQQGGLLVVAHIDEKSRGHRARFRAMRDETLRLYTTDGGGVPIADTREVSEEYKRLLADSGVNALEIMNPEDRRHYVDLPSASGNAVRLPCVVRSDAHSIEEFANPRTITYVKVSRPEFACVRDALRFFETRVKFADDLPTATPNRIVGIRLQSPEGAGLFRDSVVAFNENLNAMIGPRGAGKSTIVEALRYALGQNAPPREDDVADGQMDYRAISVAIQEANLRDTLIEVLYERGGERYCLSAAYDPREETNTEVYALDGAERHVSPQALAVEFPARIYSWSEIENLGRSPALQRQLLDRLIPDLAELKDARETHYLALSDNEKKLMATAEQLQRLAREEKGILFRFKEYRAEFERVNTPEVAALFEVIDSLRVRRDAVVAAKAIFASRGAEMGEAAAPLVIPPEVTESVASERTWWEDEFLPRLALPELADRLREAGETAGAAFALRLASIEEVLQNLNEKLAEQEAVLRERTNTSPQEELTRAKREGARRRYEAVAARRQQYSEAYERLHEVLSSRAGIVSQILEAQHRISLRRRAAQEELLLRLEAFGDGELRITATLDEGADRATAVEYLRESGILTREVFGQYKQKAVAERCCNQATPLGIAEAGLANDPAKLLAVPDAIGSSGALTLKEAADLAAHLYPFAADEGAQVTLVDVDKLSRLLHVQRQRWDDEVRILLNQVPVDKLSPGQRSSAMLPLIALSEDAPLIIDQPEDNLDNRHVGKVLTRILAELKEHRQIILATHNPNIVVGGDAEQVIVLRPDGVHRAEVELMGCIDDGSIIDAVIGIMEGGKEAFRARERRYEEFLN